MATARSLDLINGVSSSFTQIIKFPQSYCLFSLLFRFFSLQAQHLFSQSLGISAWRLVLTRLLPPFSWGYNLRTFLWPSSQLSHKLWELRARPIWREWRILNEVHSPEGRSCKTCWAGRRVEKRRPLKPADTHLLPEAPPKALTLRGTRQWELMGHRGRGKASKWPIDQSGFPPSVLRQGIICCPSLPSRDKDGQKTREVCA